MGYRTNAAWGRETHSLRAITLNAALLSDELTLGVLTIVRHRATAWFWAIGDASRVGELSMANGIWTGIEPPGILLAGLSTMLLCACDSVIVAPHLNPHPTKWVTIRVFAPQSLKIQLSEGWSPNSHPFFSSGACNLPGGVQTPLYVPVVLKWNGTSYVGSFLEDRYLPSRCDWSFNGLISFAPSHDTTVIYSDFSYQANPTFNTSDRSTELWCGIDPAPKDLPVEVCIFLSYFAKYSSHFPRQWLPAAAESEARVAQGREGNLFITPNAKSVELHYRDFDAEARAATRSQ